MERIISLVMLVRKALVIRSFGEQVWSAMKKAPMGGKVADGRAVTE